MYSRIKKLLIANRGEIARRIIRACESLGIETVVVASDPDQNSLAAREAGEVVALAGSTARETYLNKEAIIAAARSTGCDAIHPGYGFLSEDGDFAQAVIDAGLIFVGPSPQSIRALGVKTTARETVTRAGVPVTPGSSSAGSDEDLERAAHAIGLPVIIKAAAGGGGRGMRIVRAIEEMRESLAQARSEALKNFGSPDVFIEKYIEEPRHVEVQIFGDTHGKVIHFGTRDCSSQRRHQKLLEEAPAPFLDPDIREKIHHAAVAAAKSVGYYNAGTAEFLVKGRDFYFLEINTRIQVEHPITEAITGIDLVALQIKVAMGEPLPCEQSEVRFQGHAIELRINAEDSMEGFRPATGTIASWTRASRVGIREDSGYQQGDTIPPFYDSLLSKVIVRGETRAHALSEAFQFLRGYAIEGVPTTIPFHAWILSNPQFQENGIDIGYVERTFTAEGAREALSFLARDPAHREPGPDGSPYQEIVTGSALPAGAVSLTVVHEQGGTFLAVPVDAHGQTLPKEHWRRALTRAALVGS